MATMEGENYVLAYPSLPDLENPAYVSYGLPHYKACAHHVENTFQAQRVYVLASGTLSKQTGEVEKLKAALGHRFVGVYVGMKPHTPWNEVLEASAEARARDADCIVTIGGGSLVDGAKAMLLFLANGITTIEGIYELSEKCLTSRDAMHTRSKDIPITAPTIPLICIPTTLSGGEYSWFAEGTDPITHHKLVMGHPFCGPRLIINDPKLSITSPEWVWLSTGVRAIDHCVECFCRTQPEDADLDEACLDGFRKIVPSLLITKSDWANEEARLQSMLGVCRVMIMLKKGALPGASHGIGHQLGPLGVGHGETSCILLPSVMKWNARVNADKQEKLNSHLWTDPAVRKVLKARGLQEGSSDVGDALDAIFRELGMPRSLAEKGVGRDKFDALAENSLKDGCCKANPIPLERKEQVLEILEMCAV